MMPSRIKAMSKLVVSDSEIIFWAWSCEIEWKSFSVILLRRVAISRFDWCHCLETQLAGLINYARDLKLCGQVCVNVISNMHEYDIVRGADDLLPVLNKAIEGMPRLNPSAVQIHTHFDETCDLII